MRHYLAYVWFATLLCVVAASQVQSEPHNCDTNYHRVQTSYGSYCEPDEKTGPSKSPNPAKSSDVPSVSDYPTKFLVRSEQMARGGDNTCRMELEAGNLIYQVSQEQHPIRWNFCGTFQPGASINGKLVPKGNYIEVVYYCCADLKHQQGKWKKTKWHVESSFTVQ